MTVISKIMRDIDTKPDISIRNNRFALLSKIGAALAMMAFFLAIYILYDCLEVSKGKQPDAALNSWSAWEVPSALILLSLAVLATWRGKPWGLAAPRGVARVAATLLSAGAIILVLLTQGPGVICLVGFPALAVSVQQFKSRKLAYAGHVLLAVAYFAALAAISAWIFSSPAMRPLAVSEAIAVAALSLSAMLVDLARSPGRFIVYEDPAGFSTRRMIPLAMILPLICVFIGIVGSRLGFFDNSGVILALTVIPSMTLVLAVWLKSVTIHAGSLAQRRSQSKLRRRSVGLEASVARGIEDLRRVNEDLKKAKELSERRALHMQRVFDTVESYVGVLAPDGTVLLINRSALEVSGLTMADVAGKKFAQTGWFSRYPEMVNQMEEIIKRGAAGERFRQEIQYETAAGSVRISDFVIAPLFGDDGKVEYLIPSGFDITARKEFEDQMVRARVEAEIANRAKSAFLTHMSHELRSPLGIILGFIDLAIEEKDEVEKRRHLETIKRNAQQLLALVDEVLDLGKIESGKISIDIEDVQLDRLIDELSTSLQIKARERGIGLSFDVAPGTPIQLRTDPLRLKQILLNVVGNGVKYTEKGNVSCRVSRRFRDSDNAEMIEFRVTDTGIGISKDDTGRLFVPFTRGQQRKYSGTGLGLVLSRRLARLLGGDVELERSELGKGSTFVVSIAASRKVDEGLAGISSHAMGVEGAIAPQGKLSGMRILVVDDVADNRLLISRYLEAAGASVATATGGGEAVAMALQDGYDVVLMDLSMPDMSGQDATETMRKEGYRIPIVALTAHAMREEKERALAHGFNDYLTKPVVRDVLIDAMARIHDAVKRSA